MSPLCVICARHPDRVNNIYAECSHIDCPHRGRCWRDGTGYPTWQPETTADPLGELFDGEPVSF